MENKNIQEDWEEIFLKSCIKAEKMYQLESDETLESWPAIYNANVIQKILQYFLKLEKEEWWKKIDELPRIEITHKDGSKSKAILEHSLDLLKDK